MGHNVGDVLYVHRIERHDPHRVWSVYGHDKYPEGRKVTILEHLQESGPHIVRADIVLMGIWDPPAGHCATCQCDLSGRQVAVYATPIGTLSGDGVEYLSEEDRQWALEEAARIVRAAEEYPEMGIYLKI